MNEIIQQKTAPLNAVTMRLSLSVFKRFLATALALVLLSLQLNTAFAENDGKEKTWKVNLKEADIRAFISQVSDITGYSFVVDPRVKGKVTVVSNTAMTKEDVYALFNSVLNVHGFATVPSGSVIKLVPNQTAKQNSIPLRQDREIEGEELVTRVIPIVNTPAIELVPILRPLIPQYGHLAGVASANALIISDHSSNIKRILDIIDRLDTAESEELEVIQLREAWVGDVVDLLQNLEPVESGKKSGRSARSSAAKVTVVAEERTNRLIVKGEKSARARIRALVVELDQPSKFSGATKVIYLRHADAMKVAEILKNMESERKGGGRGKKENQAAERTNIQADDTLNALVIRAQPSEMAWMEEVVRQLDIRRAQVLIEAAIVEVSGDDSDALGIQWASLNQNGGVGGISFSNLGTNLNGVISAIAGSSSGTTAPVGLADGITIGGGERNSAGDSGYGALLQAIASSSSTNLLSTPSIMTLDNEEAEIIVGQNVPFITGSTTNTNAGTTNPFQTISREDVGLTLKVVPQINDGDVVRLEVEQEVSSVVPSTEAVQSADLITNKRSIKTTILADDGETLVLGGLIQDDFTDSEQKVPLLGDIPVVGRLFKSKTRTNVKRNLLVFLQPRIIRETAQARAVTDEKYGRVRTIQLEIDKSGNIFNLFRPDNKRLPVDEADLLEGKRIAK